MDERHLEYPGHISAFIHPSPSVDTSSRKHLIANVLNLIRVSKGKNLILTSGATTPLEMRGAYDMANL